MPRPARPGPDVRQEARRSPRCPGCGSREVEVISLFGQQAITLQYRCHRCATPFEALKYEEDDDESPVSRESGTMRRPEVPFSRETGSGG